MDESLEDRQKDNPQVKPDRPVLNVVEIILDTLVQIGTTGPAIERRYGTRRVSIRVWQMNVWERRPPPRLV